MLIVFTLGITQAGLMMPSELGLPRLLESVKASDWIDIRNDLLYPMCSQFSDLGSLLGTQPSKQT